MIFIFYGTVYGIYETLFIPYIVLDFADLIIAIAFYFYYKLVVKAKEVKFLTKGKLEITNLN